MIDPAKVARRAFNLGVTRAKMEQITGFGQTTIVRHFGEEVPDITAVQIESALLEYLDGERVEFNGDVFYLRRSA